VLAAVLRGSVAKVGGIKDQWCCAVARDLVPTETHSHCDQITSKVASADKRGRLCSKEKGIESSVLTMVNGLACVGRTGVLRRESR